MHYADTMILAGIYRRLRRSVSRTLTRPDVLRIDNLEFAGPGSHRSGSMRTSAHVHGEGGNAEDDVLLLECWSQ